MSKKIIFYILGFIFITIGQTCCQSENTAIRGLGGTLCAIGGACICLSNGVN